MRISLTSNLKHGGIYQREAERSHGYPLSSDTLPANTIHWPGYLMHSEPNDLRQTISQECNCLGRYLQLTHFRHFAHPLVQTVRIYVELHVEIDIIMDITRATSPISSRDTIHNDSMCLCLQSCISAQPCCLGWISPAMKPWRIFETLWQYTSYSSRVGFSSNFNVLYPKAATPSTGIIFLDIVLGYTGSFISIHILSFPIHSNYHYTSTPQRYPVPYTVT